MKSGIGIVLALLPIAAMAQPAAPDAGAAAAMAGNLPAGFYPRPDCAAPSTKGLIKPNYNDPLAVSGYNARIKDFNKQTILYNDCMQTYAAKVNNDLQGILSVVNGAVAEAMGNPPPASPTVAGNMPLGFYPKSSCAKPDRSALGATPSPKDRAAMTAYNQQVKLFNDQVTAFNACLKAYQDKAKHDIDEIQAESNAAIAAGKQNVAEPPNR